MRENRTYGSTRGQGRSLLTPSRSTLLSPPAFAKAPAGKAGFPLCNKKNQKLTQSSTV